MISTFYFVKDDSISIQSQSNQLRKFIISNPKSHAIVVKFEDQFNVIVLTTDRDYVKYKDFLSECRVPLYRIFHLTSGIAVSMLSQCLTSLLSD